MRNVDKQMNILHEQHKELISKFKEALGVESFTLNIEVLAQPNTQEQNNNYQRGGVSPL